MSKFICLNNKRVIGGDDATADAATTVAVDDAAAVTAASVRDAVVYERFVATSLLGHSDQTNG